MISIVIINYNTFDLTKSCIESIYLRETDRTKYEIILVDNNSSEKNASIFKEIFPEIILIKSNENGGFAKGNNLGISNAKGELILLLNSDTVLLNNAITKAAQYLVENEEVGVVSGKLLNEDKTVQPVAGRFPSIRRELFDIFRLSKFLNKRQRAKYYLGTEADYSSTFEADWVWGAFFMFRKDDLSHFPDNQLHEDFFMYFEDVQWCYHFKKYIKKRVVFFPEPEVVHYMGGSSSSKIDEYNKYMTKILPNTYKWMIKEKGLILTQFFFILKSIHHLTLRQTTQAHKYLKIALVGLNE